jgi:Methyl-CpG binding domain
MSMDGEIVRIEKLSNGFEVEIRDGKKAKKSDSSYPGDSYSDPWCGYVFKTKSEVIAFLDANLDKAVPAASFDDSFDAAVAESGKKG